MPEVKLYFAPEVRLVLISPLSCASLNVRPVVAPDLLNAVISSDAMPLDNGTPEAFTITSGASVTLSAALVSVSACSTREIVIPEVALTFVISGVAFSKVKTEKLGAVPAVKVPTPAGGVKLMVLSKVSSAVYAAAGVALTAALKV